MRCLWKLTQFELWLTFQHRICVQSSACEFTAAHHETPPAPWWFTTRNTFPSCEGNTGWESYFLHFNLLFPLPLARFEITSAIVVNTLDALWHTLISKEIRFFFGCRWKLIVLRDRSVFQMETSVQRDFSLWLKRLKPAKHLCNPLSNPRSVSSR